MNVEVFMLVTCLYKMADHEEEGESEDHVDGGDGNIHLGIIDHQQQMNSKRLSYQLSLFLCQPYFHIFLGFWHIITKPNS